MIKQRTIRRTIRATGRGSDSGRPVSVTLWPAAAGSGILFRRVDLQQPALVKATLENTRESGNGTILEQDSVRVVNSRHLLAALAGMGIDNVCADLTAPEVPLIGGGTGPFAYLVQSAGAREQDAPRRYLRVRRRVMVEHGGGYALLEPFDGFRIDLEDAAGQAGSGPASYYSPMDFTVVPFVSEVQGAFAPDGLQNSSPGSAAAVPETRNSGCREAFLKQRLLSSLGDLSLLGRTLIGGFSGRGTGSVLNNRLLRKLLADDSAWDEVVFDPDCRGVLGVIPG